MLTYEPATAYNPPAPTPEAQLLTEPVCIVDGHFGVYVPQVWAQRYGEAALLSAGVDHEDLETLEKGPDSEPYWEAWWSVLDNYCHEVQGVKHYLHQDGDLFEYPETCDFDNFFS
jgi:hypothetical protein